MKRILAFIMLLALVFVLTGCGERRNKRAVFNIVKDNYDIIVKACLKKDADALYGIEGVTRVDIADGYVVVFCIGAGIATSSQDYGFYYSEDNIPVVVDCNLDVLHDVGELTPEGKGYQCIYQRNTFYTEHIKGNIYFYSNAY